MIRFENLTKKIPPVTQVMKFVRRSQCNRAHRFPMQTEFQARNLPLPQTIMLEEPKADVCRIWARPMNSQECLLGMLTTKERTVLQCWSLFIRDVQRILSSVLISSKCENVLRYFSTKVRREYFFGSQV